MPAARDGWGLTLVAGLAIGVLTWPLRDFGVVEPGNDGSWVIALHEASRTGLNFGTQITWTYGPLGFLTVPVLSYPLQGALSLLYVAFVQAGLAVSVLWASRRSLPLWLAIPVTLAACVAVTTTESDDRLSAAVLVGFFIACVAVLRGAGGRQHHRAMTWAFPLLAGTLAGMQSLVRLNAGLTILILGAVTCAVAFPAARARALGLFAITAGACAAALWALTGQPLDAVLPYLSHAGEMLSGHSQALATEESPAWEYPLVAATVLLLAGVAWVATRRWPPSARWAALALAAILVFSAFKQGFVRHDESHAPFFFACALGVLVAFGWSRRAWWLGAPAAGALVLVTLMVSQQIGPGLLPPERSPLRAAAQVRMLFAYDQAMGPARATVREQTEVDERTVDMVDGHTTHVWPSEAALAWAYPEIPWRPMPTLQSKIAYTGPLDRLDARMLASGSAPQRILRSPEDDRFEAPAAGTALFCHYTQLRATKEWQVLARVPDRCGPARTLARVRTRTGESVSIPDAGPNAMVVARFRGLGEDTLGRLQTFLFRAPKWRVDLGSNGHDLAPGTASGPITLRIPTRLDYPGDYARSTDENSMTIRAGSRWTAETSDDTTQTVTVEFLAVPLYADAMAPPGGAAPAAAAAPTAGRDAPAAADVSPRPSATPGV